MDNMFSTLMQLPLLQGASHESLASLIEKYPFHFLKFKDGEQVITAGDESTHLRFVISGSVKVVVDSHVLRMSVTQVLDAPDVLAPSYLFGLHTNYPFDAYALGDCGILQIRKADYVEILQTDKVYLFNILNYLSRISQNNLHDLIKKSSAMISHRLASMILSLTTTRSRDIVVNFKQKDLCALLGARRTSVVNALDEMKALHILDYKLSEIKVFDRRALLDYCRQ